MKGKKKKFMPREEKTKKIFKSKITWCLVAVLVVFCGLTGIKLSYNYSSGKIGEKFGDVERVGRQGVVNSAVITNRKTGTAPFDTTEGRGNDVSQTDNIVRSFDKVSWNIETTMKIKDGQTATSITGGDINVEVTLPESCVGVVSWDIDSMSWTEGTSSVSENGRVFSAKYHMSDQEVTVPGKQNIEIVLDVLGARNDLEITPQFKFWIEGNDDSEKITINDIDTLKASAAANYNIQLKRNTYTSNKVTVNYDGEDKVGRIYGYGIVLQLYNQDKAKGIKGLEAPKSDINFDIDLKLERPNESGILEDITSTVTPVLWNYKINKANSYGNIENRDMNFNNSSVKYARGVAPLGVVTSNREESIYNSGEISMTQNGGKISTTINGYAFDGIFPKYDFEYDGSVHSKVNYTDNIGCFSAGYFQVFVPLNDETTIEGRKCKLTVSDLNMSVNSLSDVTITNQMKNDDDQSVVEHDITKAGTYSQLVYLSGDKLILLPTQPSKGDAYGYVGQDIYVTSRLILGQTNESDVNAANNLVKFDGNCVEPRLDPNGKKYIKRNFDGSMEFNLVYLTKKDGTNWLSQEEMNNANIEDLDWYENISDIPADKICIGVYLESTSGNLAASSGPNNIVNIPLRIKNDAKAGAVYGFSEKTQMWLDSIDRSVYTIKNNEPFTYPTPIYDSGNINYVKSEYDDEGNYLNNNDYRGGTSLLVLGAKQNISIDSLDNSGNSKSIFDLGRNESEVTYKITPSLSKYSEANSDISGVTLKITDKLDKGLTYVQGSTENYPDPEVTLNSDGTTTLIWEIYGCNVGTEISPIKFKAKINEETENSTKLTNTAVIYADRDKVGNPIVSKRTVTSEIQVTNLAAHRLYKEVSTPVIEKNGSIKYTLTYLNKTDSIVPDFQLIDILPYNGDTRGSSFNGSYKLDHIDIHQTSNDASISNDNLQLYITNNPDARNLSAKDSNIGVSDIWTEKAIGNTLNEEATSFAIKGEVREKASVKIDVYLKTSDNNDGDSYVNIASAQTSKNTDPIQTTAVGASVVTRKISGMVWYDTNENGIKDASESYAKDVAVTLKKSDSTTVVLETTTDENGKYEFSSIPKDDYIVEITTDSKYKLTTSNVGSDLSINSKFNNVNNKMQSSVIKKLNSIASPVLKQEYENAGLVVKDSKIIVKYLDLNNNEITYKDYDTSGNEIQKSYGYELTGKIGENYTTQKKDIPGYIYRNSSNNTQGVYTEENTTVIYYYEYNKKDVTVTNVWDDNNNIAAKRPGSIIVELYQNGNLKENYNVTNTSTNTQSYTFKDLDKYDVNGNEYNYTVNVKETNEGDLKFYTKTVDDNTNTVTNKFTVPDEKINITATNKWDDNNNSALKRPSSVIIELYANGVLKNSHTLTDTTSDTQSYTFENLLKYDNLGNEIVYTINLKEVNEGDFEFYSKTIDSTTNTITNKFTVPDDKVSVTVTNTWNDNNNENNVRPNSFTFKLKNNNDVVGTYTITNTTANSQTYTFDNLPKYDNSGNVITYTVDCVDVTGYDKNINGLNVENVIKKYNILTKVDGDGGKISGQNDEVYETVTYYGNSKKDIVITPDYGYKISSIKVNDIDIQFTPNDDGTYTLDKFTNVEDNKSIVVKFERKDAVVIVNYILEDGSKLEESTIINGKVGDNYEAQNKEFYGYELKQNSDNVSGTMKEEPTVVTYTYSLIKGKLSLKNIDNSDGSKILSGAKFKLEKLKEDGSIDETFVTIEKIVGESGILNFNELLVGKYRITQIEAPEGYKLNEKSYEFEITKDNRNISIDISNEIQKEIFTNVDTGDVILVVAISMIVISIVTLVILNKNKGKNKGKKSSNK